MGNAHNHNIFGENDPGGLHADSLDADPFGTAFGSLGGLGLNSGFGPQVRVGGNTPFRSHSFNIGSHGGGGVRGGLGQKEKHQAG